MECKSCTAGTPKEWAILPIRFTLGLLFLAMGLQNLTGVMQGVSSGFLPWLLAIVEILGGVFILFGLMTWWSSLVLAVIIVVMAIAYTLEAVQFSVMSFTYFLVVFGGLLTVMHGGRFLSMDAKCCKHSEHKESPKIESVPQEARLELETKPVDNSPEMVPVAAAAPVATKKPKATKAKTAKPKKAKKAKKKK